jgi:S1-C subfamily serine protease
MILMIASSMVPPKFAKVPAEVPAQPTTTAREAQTIPLTADAKESSDSPSLPTRPELPDVVALVEKAVVRIDVEGKPGSPRGIGSGFVIDSGGIVATNYHVVAGGGRATVTFNDGTRLRVIGYIAAAPEKDLVVLQIELSGHRVDPLVLAESLPRKGERVFAIGSPDGLDDTVTDGIVSSIRKPGNIADLQVLSVNATHIQMTTAISPGNSGGPLFNSRGEVVGVNTWKTIKAGMDSLNFAVSADDLREVLASASTRTRPLDSLPSPALAAGGGEFRDISNTREAAAILERVSRFAILSQAKLAEGSELPQLQDSIESSLTDALHSHGLHVAEGTDDFQGVIMVLLTLEQSGSRVSVRSEALVLVAGQPREIRIVWRDADRRAADLSESFAAKNIIQAVEAQMRGHASRLARALQN